MKQTMSGLKLRHTRSNELRFVLNKLDRSQILKR